MTPQPPADRPSPRRGPPDDVVPLVILGLGLGVLGLDLAGVELFRGAGGAAAIDYRAVGVAMLLALGLAFPLVRGLGGWLAVSGGATVFMLAAAVAGDLPLFSTEPVWSAGASGNVTLSVLAIWAWSAVLVLWAAIGLPARVEPVLKSAVLALMLLPPALGYVLQEQGPAAESPAGWAAAGKVAAGWIAASGPLGGAAVSGEMGWSDWLAVGGLLALAGWLRARNRRVVDKLST